MYSVTVSDYLFISHSLDHPGFGLARNLHGATLNVFITVYSSKLNDMNVVIDITVLTEALQKLKDLYHYQNLDELDEFSSELTTIEYLCSHFANLVKNHYLHDVDNKLERLEVKIEESPNASAVFILDL